MPPLASVLERVAASDLVDDPSRTPAAEPHRAQVTEVRRRRWGRTASAVALACGAAAGFLAIAWSIDAGRRKRGTRFDRAVLRFAGKLRQPEAVSAVRALSFLGSVPAVIPLAATTVWLTRRTPRLAWQVVIGACGGVLTEVGIKRLFYRRRPAIIPHLARVSSSSFPSGHSMAGASFYLTLALVATRNRGLREHRVAVIGTAALAACAIGATRVYLGVHWPTDVLGGLALGTAWASAAEAAFDLTAARRLARARSRVRQGPKKRAALVINPAAGCAGTGVDQLRAALEERFELDVHETSKAKDARQCALEALRERPELVIAGGGDGTISAVASALVGKDVALGVLPLGTSNSIAASLGIAGDPETILETLSEGETCVLDTADANGRTMILHASIGLHAEAIGNAPSTEKQRWGHFAYLKQALAIVSETEPFDVELTVDDGIVRCRATSVMIANMAPPKTVLAQGPRAASPEDGMLDVTIVSTTGLTEAVLTGMHLFKTALQGECATRDNVGFLSANAVRVVTSPSQRILIDGEEAGQGELVVRCRPGSLRVRVPRERAAVVAAPHERRLTGLPDLEIVPARVP